MDGAVVYAMPDVFFEEEADNDDLELEDGKVIELKRAAKA